MDSTVDSTLETRKNNGINKPDQSNKILDISTDLHNCSIDRWSF